MINTVMHQKLRVDKSLNMPHDEISLISDFCNACSENLGLDCDFTIRIVEDKKRNHIKTTAYFNPDDNDVCVWGKGRHVLDICRSLGHELVHMMQHQRGLITGPIKDIGGFHEDQANARAGQIIKKFIYDNNL